MDPQQPIAAAEPSSTLDNKKPTARYQILHVDTAYNGPFPGTATLYDRVDIFADADMLAELLPLRPYTPPIKRKGPIPEPDHVAVFYFRGLEANLLCHFNEVDSEGSMFQLIRMNKAFERFQGHQGDRLDISQRRGNLHESVKDRNDNLFLMISFLFDGNRIEMIAKKVGKRKRDTTLTAWDKDALGIWEEWSSDDS